ncbi:MAG TPA: DUF2460 domain-containing protein [Stellaceae bacterium]|nr:DUF2460 domain-containing protein [Stellaceae bacterium]
MTATFPTLPGLGWSVSKAPRFATRVQRAVSGRELRVLDQPNPIWTWTLSYSMLRDANDTRGASGPGVGYDELRTLMGFFLQQQGAFLPFLFDDPTDGRASGQALGTGDGSATVFQLVRTMGAALPDGGFAEPITAPNTVGAIYFDGVRQSASGYTVDPATGLVTFASPPPASQLVAADFTYFFRVRFADDTAEFENFLYQLWALKQVKLQSVFV